MDFQAELAKPYLAQSAIHHVQCSDFLRDEENAFIQCDELGNHVDDGLALAGARRTNQHEIRTLGGGQHGRQLRGVIGQRAEHLAWTVFDIQQAILGERRARAVSIPWGIQQMAHNRVLPQGFSALAEVFPHQVLGEREHRQHDVLADFPALDVLDGMGNAAPDCTDIQPRIISWQLALGYAKVKVEVLPQHFQQRWVEPRFVVMQNEGKPRACTLAPKRHRHQDQRRAVTLPLAVFTGPGKEAESKEQGISPSLLHVCPGSPVEFDKAAFQLGLRQPDIHLVAREGIQSMLSPDILAFAGFIKLLVARI
ncbi:hypothetical protein D3C78_992010 [compost metagenome]